MASIYDRISTPKDLLIEVRNHGLSTKQEDICRAQDIFGHAPVEDLASLANDIGLDENGCSTGKKGFRSEFYMVAFSIWNWEDAVRFWNEHSNPQYKLLKEAKESCDTLDRLNKHLCEEMKTEHKKRLEEVSRRIDAENKVEHLESEVYDRDLTIMELKAKLYDLMVKEAK